MHLSSQFESQQERLLHNIRARKDISVLVHVARLGLHDLRSGPIFYLQSEKKIEPGLRLRTS